MAKRKGVSIHPCMQLIPAVSPNQYQVLKRNIMDVGQLVPIVLWKGQVIDGRARLRAVDEIGLIPVFTEVETSCPESYSFSLNICRRYFTANLYLVDLFKKISEMEPDARDQFRLVEKTIELCLGSPLPKSSSNMDDIFGTNKRQTIQQAVVGRSR